MFHKPALICILIFFLITLLSEKVAAQQPTIAREWAEALHQSMQEDLARPAVQARNLFHFAVAQYDAWAAYDEEAEPYLLGKSTDEFRCPCENLPKPAYVEAARREALSFAAYRFLTSRFSQSPNSNGATIRFRAIMEKHGYDTRNYSIDYASGSPAALGNYIAQCLMQMSHKDGSNEINNYASPSFKPSNPPLKAGGQDTVIALDKWQPLQSTLPIDKDGYFMQACKCSGKSLSYYLGGVDPIGRQVTDIQTCQTPHWGMVRPFALERPQTRIRNGFEVRLYQDPSVNFLPEFDPANEENQSSDFLWSYALVAAWSAVLDPGDGVEWDISPAAMGNIRAYPKNLAGLRNFYDLETGRDTSGGHLLNPHTGQSYEKQLVARGDFTRAAVRFWAEGPNRETTPGHWLALLWYVSDQPGLTKKFNGKGQVMSALEWDVKSCFVLGSALHDAAVSAWGIKGWFDTPRPVSALRHLAALGQSNKPELPAYHPAGLPIIPGRIELVNETDPLAESEKEHVGKIKLYTWRGPYAVKDSSKDIAGAGWILAENWHPYQSKEFISPPYPGFISGHAAFSHAAAEVLTHLTGDAFFPGGLGEYTVKANKRFLHIEQGPATDVTLQWATYRDAADQASLSRIWAGTNTPFDDIPGRLIGAETGKSAFQLAKRFFYKDKDQDGYFSFEDCDDNDASVHTGENGTSPCDKGN